VTTYQTRVSVRPVVLMDGKRGSRDVEVQSIRIEVSQVLTRDMVLGARGGSRRISLLPVTRFKEPNIAGSLVDPDEDSVLRYPVGSVEGKLAIVEMMDSERFTTGSLGARIQVHGPQAVETVLLGHEEYPIL